MNTPAPIKVLIAPNAMKDSLTSTQFAKAIELGLHKKNNSVFETTLFPIADGGDGTCAILSELLNAGTHSCKVQDPIGREHNASFGWIEESKTAIIEMAETSGIHLLRNEEKNPLSTSSKGLGTLIQHVITKFGAKQIILGIGGSATVDCGFGMLQAMGVRFKDANGNNITKYSAINKVQSIDTEKLHELFSECRLTVLSDVENPLLGNNGAATVFGPQKGACNWMVKVLEQRNRAMANLVSKTTKTDQSTTKGSGAAGGVAFPLLSFCPQKVQLISGTEYLFELSSIKEKIEQCDVVITGEGSIDSQSFSGKATGQLVSLASECKKPVVALCGVYEGKASHYPFAALYSINPPNSKFNEEMTNAHKNSVTFVASIFKEIEQIARNNKAK